jgi:phosphoadenosine phosphosulfate reductase
MSAVQAYARASADFVTKLAQTEHLIRQAGQRYQPLTQACSLGAEDMVITHLLWTTGTPATVFVLDTGQLHPQTLALISHIEARYDRKVLVYHPQARATQAFEQAHGTDAMYQSIELRKTCCGIRKMEPLSRALAGQRAWLTGLRREQSPARSAVADIEADGPERVKINPLANWTAGDVWHYIGQQGIAYNALHDQFFPSIGCAPCTRAVTLGEDFRSGRWWWESDSAKECGLHLKDAGSSLLETTVDPQTSARPVAAPSPLHPTAHPEVKA